MKIPRARFPSVDLESTLRMRLKGRLALLKITAARRASVYPANIVSSCAKWQKSSAGSAEGKEKQQINFATNGIPAPKN